MPVEIDGIAFDAAFRVDILVEGSLVIEVKAVDQLSKAHAKHLLTYLGLLKQPVGLLLNFSGETMREGIRRLVNNHNRQNLSTNPLPSAPPRETDSAIHE